MRLGVVLIALVCVNIYVFFFSSGSLKTVRQAAQAANVKAPDEDALVEAQPVTTPPTPMAGPPASTASVATVPVKPKGKKHDGALKEHEGLGALLRREGVGPKDADAAMRALAPVVNFRKELKGGTGYTVRLDGFGRLEGFDLRLGGGVVVAVTRGGDGKLAAERLASGSRLGHH